MAAFFPQIECVLIDADGNRSLAVSESFDVYNVTQAASVGGYSSDANGIIASQNVGGVNDSDILEFSHATYPGTYRCIAKTMQMDAFTMQGRRGTTYIVENLQTPLASTRATLVAVDTDNPDAVPFVLGTVESGTTTEFGLQKGSVARNYRIYPITETKVGSIAKYDYELQTTEYADVNIPAASSSGLADGDYGDVVVSGSSTVFSVEAGQFKYGSLRVNDNADNHYATVRIAEDLSANRILNVILNDATRTLTIAGNATVSGTNTGDQVFYEESIAFTDGDTSRRVTITNAVVSSTSKIVGSVTRPTTTDPNDPGYIYISNVISRGSGTFDLWVTCLDIGGIDPVAIPPNETVLFHYTVG